MQSLQFAWLHLDFSVIKNCELMQTTNDKWKYKLQQLLKMLFVSFDTGLESFSLLVKGPINDGQSEAGMRGGRPPSPSPKRDDVEKTASVAFLMPYNCSKKFLTLCKLVISSIEACIGVGTKPPNTQISLPNIMNRTACQIAKYGRYIIFDLFTWLKMLPNITKKSPNLLSPDAMFWG